MNEWNVCTECMTLTTRIVQSVHVHACLCSCLVHFLLIHSLEALTKAHTDVKVVMP